VRATFPPGSNAMIEGRAVTNAQLAADVSGHPTLVALGSLRFYVIERGERIGVRVTPPRSKRNLLSAGPEVSHRGGVDAERPFEDGGCARRRPPAGLGVNVLEAPMRRVVLFASCNRHRQLVFFWGKGNKSHRA